MSTAEQKRIQRMRQKCEKDNTSVNYTEDGIPIVLCRGGGLRLHKPAWYFRCPWCEKMHLHSPGEGHRVSHCDHEGAKKRGYILQALDQTAHAAADMAKRQWAAAERLRQMTEEKQNEQS